LCCASERAVEELDSEGFAHSEEEGFELHAAAEGVFAFGEDAGELVGLAGGKEGLGECFKFLKREAARGGALFERGEVDVGGDVASAGIAENVFARGVAAVAHQRAGGEAHGFGASVAVVDGEDEAGAERTGDAIDPGESVEVHFITTAFFGRREVTAEVVVDLG